MYHYPITMFPSALEKLWEAKIFLKLEQRSAYNLVRSCKGDKWQMAFNITSGHFKYRIMLYGLSSSPDVFQCHINDIGYTGEIRQSLYQKLIYSSNKQTHVTHVKKELARLLENQLYIKLENVNFVYLQGFSVIVSPLTALHWPPF